MPLDGLNHVTLRVRDLERSERFYCDLLGLERVGQRGDFMRFYSSGRYHHELALLLAPEMETVGDGLMHIGWNVPDQASLLALYRRCTEAGVAMSGGVNHQISHSFYLRDPDGYQVEITLDRPRTEWSGSSDAFERDSALDLDQQSE